MKIKWGMMMTDGRGKLGGQVASKNRSGAYVRTKVTPTNPRTMAQSIVRSLFGILSKNWGQLEESTRDTWNRSADSGLFAKTNVFGDTVRHSGKSLYTSVNTLARIHQNINFTFPPQPATFNEQDAGANLTITVDDGLDSMLLEPSYIGDAPMGSALQVQATAPLSAGISNFNSYFRDIFSVVVPVAGPIANFDLASDYIAKFGANVNEGAKVGVRYRQIVDGQASPWVVVSAIAEEATP